MKNKLIQFQMGLDNVEVREGLISIVGYASTPTIDRYNSIVEVEGVRNGLENYKENPVLLLGHDSTKPIGSVVEWEIDEKGRKVRAEVTRDTDGVMTDITEGRTKGFSIGFFPLAWHYIDRASGRKLSDMTEEEQNNVDYKNIVRVISKVDIVELSVVNVPANPQSLFTISKALRAYFAELETREVAKRYLVSEIENPFNEVKDDKKSENEEGQEATEEEEIKEEEANEDQASVANNEEEGEEEEDTESDDEEVEEPKEKADEQSDISTEETEYEDGSDGESPDAVTDTEDQDEVDEVEKLKLELQEERQFNESEIDKLLKKVEALQKQVESRAVNKPVLHQRPEAGDTIKDVMLQAKRGF